MPGQPVSDATGKLEKACMRVVDGEVSVTELRFMFNPTEYTVSKSAKWTRPTTSSAKSATKPEFGGANPQAVSMEIFFDDFEAKGDVAARVQTLLDWTKPTTVSVNKKQPSPPILVFEWGSNPALAGFRGYLKTVTAKYTLFTPRDPLRASAKSRWRRSRPRPRARTRHRARSTAGAATCLAMATASTRSRSRSTATRRCGAASRSTTGSTTRCACAPATRSSSRAPPKRRNSNWALTMAGQEFRCRPRSRSTARRWRRTSCPRSSGGRRRPPPPAGHVRARVPGHRPKGPVAREDQDRITGQGRGHAAWAASCRSRCCPGEVTAIEAEYDALGARAIVRGYDHSHRLHRGRRTETYRNVKDSDIAAQIARRAGVQVGTVDDSRTTHEHVSQANVSDWEFLQARAREIGFEVLVADGKLQFRKPVASAEAPAGGDFSSKDPLQLVIGQDLLEFRPRITSSEQVKEVEVRGWDPIKKQAVVGSAAAGTTSAKLSSNPGAAGRHVREPRLRCRRPSRSRRSVRSTLPPQSIAERIGSAFAEADGVVRGNPKLRAGTAVSVSVVADDFAGGYTPRTTRHVFDHEGYRTEFIVSGRQERSILGLPGRQPERGSAGDRRICGHRGRDRHQQQRPEKLGRVKLKFPWLADAYESDWARIVQLGAGPNSGPGVPARGQRRGRSSASSTATSAGRTSSVGSGTAWTSHPSATA